MLRGKENVRREGGRERERERERERGREEEEEEERMNVDRCVMSRNGQPCAGVHVVFWQGYGIK